jgi:xylan 1,4-beta-xylosidase
MGSPQQPTPDQYAELVRSGQLALLDSPGWVRAEGGRLTLRVSLPRQAVSLLRLDLHATPDAEDKGR